MSQSANERLQRRRRKQLLLYLIPVIAGLLGFGLVALYLSRQDERPAAPAAQTANQNAAQPTQVPPADELPRAEATPTPADSGGSIMSEIFGIDESAPTGAAQPESLTVSIPRILVRLALAALLATILAFRPRKDLPLLQRNPFVAQTQILLAVVASSLMMIVGDNAARAFGIFAAASLVRFRTNIRDPKEITVLLVSLAIGLATGVGRWDLAVVLALFVLPLLWGLEYYEVIKIYRSMELTVRTRNTDTTQAALKRIFRRHKFNYEVRQLDPPDEAEPIGCIVFYVSISIFVPTDQLNDEMLAVDRGNIEGIEWEQQKSDSYIYQ
ncbi:MAG: DUF4956 domain-containing protein [Acidobacteriota bacterium]|nr:DUF4956 domain-containing protein [Acidobacteriota bacterium]